MCSAAVLGARVWIKLTSQFCEGEQDGLMGCDDDTQLHRPAPTNSAFTFVRESSSALIKELQYMYIPKAS